MEGKRASRERPSFQVFAVLCTKGCGASNGTNTWNGYIRYAAANGTRLTIRWWFRSSDRLVLDTPPFEAARHGSLASHHEIRGAAVYSENHRIGRMDRVRCACPCFGPATLDKPEKELLPEVNLVARKHENLDLPLPWRTAGAK